jgi:hypothetical protein
MAQTETIRKHNPVLWIMVGVLVFSLVAGGLAGSYFAFWRSSAPATILPEPSQGGFIPPAPTETPTPTETPEPTPAPPSKIEVEWESIGPGEAIERVFIDPKDKNTIYAIESLGIFRDRVWRLKEGQAWENLGERSFKFGENNIARQVAGLKVPGPDVDSLYFGFTGSTFSISKDEEVNRRKLEIARQILPKEQPALMALAKDPGNKEITLALILISQPAALFPEELEKRGIIGLPTIFYPRLFLSVDGENSWIEINLSSLPNRKPNPDPELFREPLVEVFTIAVTSERTSIKVFLVPLPGGIWQTTIPMASLPD